ncbi:hypothetical protein QE152_g19984 [Popillia japonica]|uniref:Peptidase aspartic putative domain-containing protein n=1 Tax=Popillia japonica TaxID=7064 RepID=A0AAW1KPQ8_POPJA
MSFKYVQEMWFETKLHTAKAVLDSGSQSSYITSDLCNKLKLPKESIELALDCKEQLPMVSKVIEQDFYVDDLLTGANEIEEATYIAQTVANILGSAGFELR